MTVVRPEAPEAVRTDARNCPGLAEVLSALDSEVLRLIGGPANRSVRITDVVILDPADEHEIGSGTIVLAVALSADGSDAVRLLEHAAGRNAAAVVFRTERPLSRRLEERAADLEIAVLGVSPGVRWGQVYSLLRTALGNTGVLQSRNESGVALGDLFALADAIAASVGGPVTIEDPDWRVLAYANLDYEIDPVRRDTILGRTPPLDRRRRHDESGLRAALRSGDGVVRVDGEPGYMPRIGAPIRAGDELLGSIWVAEAGTPLEGAAERELARTAKLATVHVLSHRASEDIKRRTRGAFVREVLEGWAPSRAAFSTARTTGPFTVLVFAPDPSDDELRPERVLSVVSLHCESRHPDAMCALIEERVWAVLPALDPDESGAMRSLAARIVDRVEASLCVSLKAAIGTTVPALADIPSSRRAAQQALDVLVRRRDADRIVHIDDVRAHAVLFEIIDWAAENDGLVHGKLDRLVEHDRRHGSSYLATLRTYLDARGDVAASASKLCVHPNTLRHRVRRLVEISALDLEDPDERLVTELQLRML